MIVGTNNGKEPALSVPTVVVDEGGSGRVRPHTC
jgi:hypothetical protein